MQRWFGSQSPPSDRPDDCAKRRAHFPKQILLWHEELHEVILRASYAPRRHPALALQPRPDGSGSPRCRRAAAQAQIFDRVNNGQPAPSEASATQPDDVRPPLRVVDAGRDSVSREDNLGSIQTVAAIASPSPRAELNLYQREKASQPASLRLGAAARSYGAPDTGDLRGPRPPRVPIGQASVSRRIRRGRLRAVLDPLRNAPSRRKF